MARGETPSPTSNSVIELRPPSPVDEPDWWTPNAFYRIEAERFAEHYDVDPALALRLLKADHQGWEQAAAWLTPSGRMVVSPEQTVVGMNAAGEQVLTALRAKTPIAIYADYDPDGTCGAEALRLGLQPYLDDQTQLLMGYADAQSGFGLTSDFVRAAHAHGAGLLITVDCGSSQSAQVALAQTLGMRVIVVDHHGADPDNPADFHLNPHLATAETERPLRDAEQRLREAGIAARGLPAQATQLKQEIRRLASSVDPEIIEQVAALRTQLERVEQEIATLDPTLVAEEAAARKDLKQVEREVDAARLELGSVSPNTGAPLAWKLAAAVHIADQGRTRKEHWGRAMYLAGFGCRADMGSAVLPEHRAFSWLAIDREGAAAVPPGLALLAERLGEDPLQPAGLIQTSACLNLPKRTPHVAADRVGALLRCADTAEATPIVDDLLAAYERARPVKAEMAERAITQLAAQSERRVGVVQIDDQPDYAGYAGAVATSVSRSADKPVLVAVDKGTDPLGQQLVRFAIRNSAGIPHQIGELRDDPAVLAACTIRRLDESGVVVSQPSVGGHAQVVSGTTTPEQLDQLTDAVERWAQGKRDWQRPPYTGAEAYLTERRVPAERFERLEREALRLGPYSDAERHRPMRVSVEATATQPMLDPETERWTTDLILADGIRRRALVAPDRVADFPIDRRAEYVIQLGRPGDLYLRLWHIPSAD